MYYRTARSRGHAHKYAAPAKPNEAKRPATDGGFHSAPMYTSDAPRAKRQTGHIGSCLQKIIRRKIYHVMARHNLRFAKRVVSLQYLGTLTCN